MATGLGLQAIGLGMARVDHEPDVAYSSLVPRVRDLGIGMALFFAPVANVVLSSVAARRKGKASGANNAIRELGGVFGVAVLASIFSALRRLRVARDLRGRAHARDLGRRGESSGGRDRGPLRPRAKQRGEALEASPSSPSSRLA
jgi:hypothetical protein